MKRLISEIHFRDDFDFILKIKDPSGSNVGFPSFDFEGQLYTERCHKFGHPPFKFFKRGGITLNCFDDNGKLHVVANDHKLPPGRLFCDMVCFLPDAMFADGSRKVEHRAKLLIELTEGPGDTHIYIQDEEIILPYIYKTAYQLAVNAGYEGSEEEFYDALKEIGELYTLATTNRDKIQELVCQLKCLKKESDKLEKDFDALDQAVKNEIKGIKDDFQRLCETTSARATAIETEIEELKEEDAQLRRTLKNKTEELEQSLQGQARETTERFTQLEEEVEESLNGLSEAIKEETQRATSRENALDAKISSLEAYTAKTMSLIQEDVHAEEKRARAEEGKIITRIKELKEQLGEVATQQKELRQDLVEENENMRRAVGHALEDANHYTDDAVDKLWDRLEAIPVETIRGWFK